MFKASSLSHIHRTLLKRTDKVAGPEGLAVISLQKADSLLVLISVRKAKKDSCDVMSEGFG